MELNKLAFNILKIAFPQVYKKFSYQTRIQNLIIKKKII